VPTKTTRSDKGIAHLLIDHPPVNALDSGGWFQFAESVTRAGQDPSVNVLLISAAGKGFCAGADIKELAADSSAIVQVNKGCYEAFAAVHDCAVPVIVACHGFVLGGGIGIAGSADIIIASDDATFGLPEIDRGAMGAATHLMRMFPVQKVRRMFFTGESISAEEAYRLGAVESVVSRDKLLETAMELAEKIASKSPRALRLAKEALNGIEPVDIKKNYRFEQGFTYEMYASPDSQESRDAFVEKRNAEFEKKK
jgi:enoyl-CoA hydratase